MKRDRMDPIAVILGARGSVPVCGETFRRYGGATTCVFVRLAGQPLVFDAGTGILALSDCLDEAEREIPLFLSHPHADHLIGLPICRTALDPTRRFSVYAAPRGGRDALAQLRSLISPPLWPVGPEALPAEFAFHSLPATLTIGPLTVDSMEGAHPGGVSLFRVTGDGRRIVFATDCTLSDRLFAALTEFARDCDLLLIDGQYSDAEWPTRSTFGHSTWTMAARSSLPPQV